MRCGQERTVDIHANNSGSNDDKCVNILAPRDRGGELAEGRFEERFVSALQISRGRGECSTPVTTHGDDITILHHETRTIRVIEDGL